MSIFSKTTIDAVDRTADLPAGFDESESAYYIHPDLRVAYAATAAPDPKAVVGEADTLRRHAAWDDATEQTAEETGGRIPHGQTREDLIRPRAETLSERYRGTRSAEFYELAAHQSRLEAAVRAVEAERNGAAKDEAIRAHRTCVVCTRETDTTSVVLERPLTATHVGSGRALIAWTDTVDTGHEARLCRDCERALRAEQQARALASLDADSRGRLTALVDSWGD